MRFHTRSGFEHRPSNPVLAPDSADLSTAGELEQYLRWRFSCHAGELLVLDPHLLDDKPEDVVAFLAGLKRPVRVLARSIPPAAQAPLASAPRIDARPLPNGISTLHDRI
jgi:hypothetical protein